MASQLAYALVTPYTIRKSRTGAVLARLLGRASAELIAAQMLAPSRKLAEAYADSIRPVDDPGHEKYRQLIREYIRENFAPTPGPAGRRHRTLLLVFRGEEAIADIARIAGALKISDDTGETIRDAYGDLVTTPDGTVKYFEPAVVVGDTPEATRADLRLWLDFARHEPGLLENVCRYDEPERVEQTLVLIKPDSWRQRSSRPGAIVDMFTRTGLRLIGLKLCRMSVHQALQFYGPVRDVLRRKLSPDVGVRARRLLEEQLGITLPRAVEERLARDVGVPYAEDQFERIIQFMTGVRPSECPEEERESPGRVRCLAVVYEGPDGVRKIRDVLGPTDPTQAPDGTVRREFGSDVMVNTAHASDSPDNAQREMGILKLRQSNLVSIVEPFLKESEHGS